MGGNVFLKIILSGDEQEVAIKIADQGGGIRRAGMSKIWSFLYTTARAVEVQQFKPAAFKERSPSPKLGSLDLISSNSSSSQPQVSPLAGFGCGLPLSKLYAVYLGGNMQLISMPLYGTDTYIFMNRIGDAQELLPSNNWSDNGGSRNIVGSISNVDLDPL